MTYLLLHLPHLELVPTELPVVDVLAVLLVPLADDVLHLADERAARLAHRLARLFQPVLRARAELGLDAAGGY